MNKINYLKVFYKIKKRIINQNHFKKQIKIIKLLIIQKQQLNVGLNQKQIEY